MEIDESNNPVEGTETVAPQADDTAENLDWFDPEEDTEQPETPEATDDGTEAVEEDASPEDVAAEIEASVDAVVTLPDGTKTKVSDLVAGNLRQDDYSRKTQALAAERTAFKAEVERLEGITQAMVDHFTRLVPPAPDHSMALRDHGRYTIEMAVHQAGMAQLQKLIEIGQAPKEIKDTLSKEEQTRIAREEDGRLVQRFPNLTNPQERQKFFTEAAEAAEGFGYTLQDLQGVTDHRIFTALHYAALGLKASKSMQAAKAKAEKAPPVAPQKPAAAKANANAQAMRKLTKTGSIADAMAIDFD